MVAIFGTFSAGAAKQIGKDFKVKKHKEEGLYSVLLEAENTLDRIRSVQVAFRNASRFWYPSVKIFPGRCTMLIRTYRLVKKRKNSKKTTIVPAWAPMGSWIEFVIFLDARKINDVHTEKANEMPQL